MIAYLDLWTGLSGDMMVGALLDAGWPEEEMYATLRALPLDGVDVRIEERFRHGIRGVGILVEPGAQTPARPWRTIRALIDRSGLSAPVKERSLALFGRLARVEARIHGSDPEEVHFHELGGDDAIADIVLSVAGLDGLGITRLHAGPIPLTRGEVETAHGLLPVPAPATLRLLEGCPIRWIPLEGEWTTPTGALLLSGLVDRFGPPPGMALARIGTGAGTRSAPDRANIVRLLRGTQGGGEGGPDAQVSILETNIDDLDPRLAARLAEQLFAAGALDVIRVPVLMKKGRQGTLFSVLCAPEREEELGTILLREGSTLGLRIRREERRTLERWFETVETPYGPVRVKWSRPGGRERPIVEFDDLSACAEEHAVPLWRVEWETLRRLGVDRAEPPEE
ncbi:MAG: nickel pincer cofactor biosynthesis protein LarC [Candidatus Eisenbacteria bacterium]|nr:nickel pincer cofactor biosynthesis protein LarC [Candidatus Latescibacterota bacterium]MBD3300842.1 nickel pincer cofactor biosynthesis protein LarC [Candidatus Eisenbacteria bacterium]